MDKVIISTFQATVNPVRLQTIPDWNEQIESNRFPDGQFDLEGDYPKSGPDQKAGNGGYESQTYFCIRSQHIRSHLKGPIGEVYNISKCLPHKIGERHKVIPEF